MLLRIGKAETWKFEAIDDRVTHTDGLSVRGPYVWKPLHKTFWDSELKHYGLDHWRHAGAGRAFWAGVRQSVAR